MVINATKRPMDGVEVGGKQMKFGREGWLRVKDPGVADAIRQKYGNVVTVTGVRAPDVHDRGHRFHFSVPELPWHKNPDDLPGNTMRIKPEEQADAVQS